MVEANEAACRLLGATQATLIGRQVVQALAELGHGSASLAVATALDDRAPAEFTIYDATGEPRTHWRVAALDDRAPRRSVTIRSMAAPTASTTPAEPVETLAALARDLAGEAVDNAATLNRLVEQARESAQEARLLAGATRALVEHVDPESLFAAVATLARESLGASGVTVTLADPASGRVERVWADGAGRALPAIDVAHFWASGMGRVARDATPHFFTSPLPADAPRSDEVLAAALERGGVGAAALLPIVPPGPDAASPTRGLLSLLFPGPHVFSARERRLLTDFGAYVAVAARNATVLAAHKQARDRAEAAAEIAQVALDAADAAGGADAILRVLDRVAPTAGKALRVADEDGAEDAVGDASGMLTCLAATGAAARLRGRRFAPDIDPETDVGEQAVSVRLTARGRAIGDLWAVVVPGAGLASARAARARLAPLAASVAVALDVLMLQERTRRRRREEALVGEQLRQAEKMAALGELVAGVAHEINNPLTGISAFAELLADEPLTAGQRESVRLIKREADRAGAVVRDLLAFSRAAAPAALPVDMNAVVEWTLRARARALHEAGVAVRVEVDPSLPRVRGDEAKLRQVVLNVILNAEYALRQVPQIPQVPQAGQTSRRRLVVATRRAPASGRRGERVVVTVTDSGPGMSAETLARAFEPFYTTKPPGEGTGLGLSVSYGVVQTHGGELVARNAAPPGGATFEIALPAAASPAPPAGAADGGADLPNDSQRRA